MELVGLGCKRKKKGQKDYELLKDYVFVKLSLQQRQQLEIGRLCGRGAKKKKSDMKKGMRN